MQRTELAAMLLDLMREDTGEAYADLSDATHLRDELKLDSVDMVSLLLQIETKLGIDIESSELADVALVGDLLDLLERKLTALPSQRAA